MERKTGMTKLFDSPSRLTSSITNKARPRECHDAATTQLKQVKKGMTSILPGYVLLVGALFVLVVGSITASPQVGAVKNQSQKNATVVPHNPRIRQRREDKGSSAGSTSNLSFNSNLSTPTTNKTPVTSRPQSAAGPMLIILGGALVGLLALAGTFIAGIVIFKSVRAKRA